MQRYRLGLILIMVLVLSLALTRMDRLFSGAAVEVLGSAMSATGASVERVRISGWVKLPQQDVSDEQLIQITETAVRGLGFKPTVYELQRKSSERQRMVRAELIDGRLQALVSAQVILMPSGPEAYLAVNIEAGAQQATLKEWHKKTEAILAKAGSNHQITTCLVGWLDGKLEKDEWGKRLEHAGRVLHVVETETLHQPNFISVTGFSPVLPEWLEIADKRVNVNMAMRYSPYDNRTYVFIGSPVIAGEY